MTHVRHDPEAYARYLKNMDASMRVKVALTAAHVLSDGTVADMGMGSGGGSAALAGLYPSLHVVGVDLDASLVARASSEHRLPNLSFREGDIGAPLFEDGSLQAIFDSSVLHHVTSFQGYRRQLALDALSVQARALAVDGVLIVRDFLDPGAGEVDLELPDKDGDASDDPRRCSTAQLFERFSREARSLSPTPGETFQRVEGAGMPEGWRRFRTSLRAATEFLLRKDYRTDWEAEIQEEYSVATLDALERHLMSLGLRVLTAVPLRNPWILRNRFEGKARLTSPNGRALDWPATNFLAVGQRVAEGDVVSLTDEGAASAQGFLELTHHRDVRTGEVRVLARRPGVTLDVIPYFVGGNDVQVVFRSAMPRPIMGSALATPAPCGSRPPVWMAEPLHGRMTDKPLGQTVEDVLASVGLVPERIRAITQGTTYYPSPGGIQEEVRSVFVEIEPLVSLPVSRDGASSSQGRLQAASAEQLLRAAQVGGLPDARLEINVRTLLRQLRRKQGPWLGDTVTLSDATAAPTQDFDALLARPPRRRFARATASERSDFLTVEGRRFAGRDSAGRVRHEEALEVVVPSRHSTVTAACLPLLRVDGVVHAGIDDDDLPAAQAFVGSSALLVAPAFRLPAEAARSLRAMDGFVREALRREFGLEVQELFELGGRYAPSPGMTPEIVYPFGVRVAGAPAGSKLRWTPLASLHAHGALLADGHLRVLAGRAAQAFEGEVGQTP